MPAGAPADRSPRAARWAALTLALLGCDAEGGARALAAQASAEAKQLSDQAASQAKSLSGDAKSAAAAGVDRGLGAVKRELFGLSDTGTLSKAASSWLEQQAKDPAAVEGFVKKGAQVAPVALEVAKVLNAAVDDETAIEPVYQKIEPGQGEKLDGAIAAMPRVEVIRGLRIGFKKLDTLSTDKMTKEQAVLVLWRQGDHLVGFLYRSKRNVDLDLLVKETPRLVKLVQATVGE